MRKQDIPPSNLPRSILYDDSFLNFEVILNFWTGIPKYLKPSKKHCKKYFLLFMHKKKKKMQAPSTRLLKVAGLGWPGTWHSLLKKFSPIEHSGQLNLL